VDLALPGTLPVMNRGAVERAIRFGLAVGAHIAPLSIFARKNYFYPDLPKGYQISQYEIPVVQGGTRRLLLGAQRSVRLTRAHLEEDAGKSLHEDYHGQTGIDLNRAGTPLLEIVTEPDMRSSAEAVEYARRCTGWWCGWASATATCRKAASAATPTCRCAAPARPSARGARSRT
jgi:aspartyl-tRNA(Asn)/glutamyl-tRNA(Gln) amidotransferase subunit B